MRRALFALLIYFRAGPADSEGSGPVDTGPVGADLVVISDMGPIGSCLRNPDLVDADQADSDPADQAGPADPDPADIGPDDTGPADIGRAGIVPADPDPADP